MAAYKAQPLTDNDRVTSLRNFKPEYCQDIIDFFSVEPIRYDEEVTVYKDGSKHIKKVPVANKTPFLIHWCRKIGIYPAAVSWWCKNVPEFDKAVQIAKQLQESFLAECGLKNAHNAFMSFQALKNVSGWREKKEIDQTNSGTTDINVKLKKEDLLSRDQVLERMKN